MPKFITDWTKIGQSGPTVDGRVINPEWLDQAAADYSPDVYTAMIWVEHRRWYGNYGQVKELKAEKEGQVTSLYARLQPNTFLLDANRYEQALFTSMELDPDFANSGKCYLVGLGVTDEPASLGTHELRFNKRKQQDRNLMLCGVRLENLAAAENDGGALVRMFGDLLRHIKRQPDNPTDEDDTMKEQQFTQLMASLDAQKNALAELTEKFSTLTVAPAAPAAPANPAPATPAAPAAPAQPAGDDGGAQQQFAALTAALDGLTAKFTALETRMEAAVPGTATPAITQPAGGEDLL
jgi:hypothetical protein